MRGWLVVGAAALALAGSVGGAEARGRGFGRLSFGRAPTPYPVAAPVAAPRLTGETRASARPGIAILPAPAVAGAAAGAVPVAAAAELRLSDDPPARAVAPAPRPAAQPVQEARAAAAPCAPGRRVGALAGLEDGFCLIN